MDYVQLTHIVFCSVKESEYCCYHSAPPPLHPDGMLLGAVSSRLPVFTWVKQDNACTLYVYWWRHVAKFLV